MQIVFIHPDLGIGGAERLVVDAALALKEKGHRVSFMTGHHDRQHCFEETKNGTFSVNVVGGWLPRSVFGMFHAFLAYFKMIYISFYLILISALKPDVIFCDQISACIPFLKFFTKAKIVFYCHFPDQLLTKRTSLIKSLYRMPIDWLEEKSTGMSDMLFVNSQFTEKIFKETFKTLRDMETHVLYPSLNTKHYDQVMQMPTRLDSSSLPTRAEHVFLSINRYERKKNLSLAIEALDLVRDRVTDAEWKKVHLVMAGGYDQRVEENVNHYRELSKLAEKLKVDDKVSFLQSISNQKKVALYRRATGVLYTPHNEHFGIVPIEAMYLKKPVIAVNSGGPLETIADGQTGFLRPPNSESFATAMLKLMQNPDLVETMGEAGRARVVERFSFENFAETLNEIVVSLVN
uniref:Alpha-1,3/1,6-mannosyltransferase ALG2 n=1 Tax=Phallusia mammillata TaxID=59560 RepID=A0A6F9D702_9ASCI|nr:alpha-1,3/1,6-mannosyltransferase ALG2-like [Phallusia mammillata]